MGSETKNTVPERPPIPEEGRPPTPEEDRWLKWLDELSPEKSIDRLDNYGKYLLGAVSTVGTVLTGFGVFGDIAAKAAINSWMLATPVALAALSMAAASLAIAPVAGTIRLPDPDSIRDYFSLVIRKKKRRITAASILFTLSFASAAVVLVGAGLNRSSTLVVRPTFNWMRSSDGPQMNLQVNFGHVPQSARAETKVVAWLNSSAKTDGNLLFDDLSSPGTDGDLSVAGKLEKLADYKSLVLTITVVDASKTLYNETMAIAIPPSSR